MRRNTAGIYFLLFVLVAGIYYFLNSRPKKADIALTPKITESTTYLFKAEDGVPIGFRIESQDGAAVEIARGADKAWVLKEPLEASADQGAVEAVASQLTTMRIVETLPSISLDVVGLKTPQYTIVVRFKENVERKATVGVVTPTESGYYVLGPEGDVEIVSKYSVDSLLALLINPPYSETPTPSPTPTETALPAPSEPATS